MEKINKPSLDFLPLKSISAHCGSPLPDPAVQPSDKL